MLSRGPSTCLPAKDAGCSQVHNASNTENRKRSENPPTVNCFVKGRFKNRIKPRKKPHGKLSNAAASRGCGTVPLPRCQPARDSWAHALWSRLCGALCSPAPPCLPSPPPYHQRSEVSFSKPRDRDSRGKTSNKLRSCRWQGPGPGAGSGGLATCPGAEDALLPRGSPGRPSEDSPDAHEKGVRLAPGPHGRVCTEGLSPLLRGRTAQQVCGDAAPSAPRGAPPAPADSPCAPPPPPPGASRSGRSRRRWTSCACRRR